VIYDDGLNLSCGASCGQCSLPCVITKGIVI